MLATPGEVHWAADDQVGSVDVSHAEDLLSLGLDHVQLHDLLHGNGVDELVGGGLGSDRLQLVAQRGSLLGTHRSRLLPGAVVGVLREALLRPHHNPRTNHRTLGDAAALDKPGEE